MEALSREQVASREKTLLAALLLSMWAPLATGIAVILSHSTTQLADFIRRSVELIALFVSWRVFRFVTRNKELSTGAKARMEKIAGISVAAAMCCSGAVMCILAIYRFPTFQPGGNVYPGLTFAFLGLITNFLFWRRYSRLTREQYNPIIDAQRRLYRAKALVDFCVIVALASIAFYPTHEMTRYIDIFGSIVVAFYLFFSGVKTARTAILNENAQSSILKDK